jgi:hypothetical protein
VPYNAEVNEMHHFRFFVIFLSLCFFSAGFAVQPIIPCSQNRQDRREGDVAICMIFQNEARFIQEWIEYHKSIGVTHFYLYNNASTDEFWNILSPYVEKGEIELFNVPERTSNVKEHNKLQYAVYNHALKCARESNNWLAIIDSDEFICMPHHDNLSGFLESYSYAAGLLVNWVMYGSSNVEELGSTDLQMDHFLCRTPDDWEENFQFKSIVRPKRVKHAGIHYSYPRSNYKHVFANHEKYSKKPRFNTPPIDEIRINHYWWRDEKYFREVKLPRKSGWMKNFSEEEIEVRRQIYNSVYDPSILPFAERVREKLFLTL